MNPAAPDPIVNTTTHAQSPTAKFRTMAPAVGLLLTVGKRGGCMNGMAARRLQRQRGAGEAWVKALATAGFLHLHATTYGRLTELLARRYVRQIKTQFFFARAARRSATSNVARPN